MEEDSKSVYLRAAECGLPLGAVSALAATLFLYCDKVPLLAYVAMGVMLCLPCMVYRYERAALLEEHGQIDLPGLCMMGMLMTLYASLLTGLVSFAEMEWLRPGYVLEQVQSAIEVLKQLPDDEMASSMLKEMNRALEDGLLPRPIEVVMNMFWMSVTVGSMASFVVSMIVNRIGAGDDEGNEINQL